MTENPRCLVAYKQQVREHLTQWLIGESVHPYFAEFGYSLTFENVSLEENELYGSVYITFREASRAECLFGFRANAVEPSDIDGKLSGGSESWAYNIFVNLDECLTAVHLGLPDECELDGVTWLNP